jgi:hypothetical protein
MREFTHTIQDTLLAGISPDERSVRNPQFLFDAYNVKVTQYGLKYFEPIIDPSQGGWSVNFPFPQMFQTPKQTLLASQDTLYQVDTTIVPWQRDQLPTVGMNGAPKNIVPGGVWQFVNLMDGWMLFNGECIVFRDVHQQLEFKNVVNRVVDDVSIQSACHHRGRIVIGGFNPEKFWGDGWDKFFDLYKEQLSEPMFTAFDDMDKNYIVWSSIGGGDFPLWLFKPEAAVYSNITEHSKDYGFSYKGIDTTMMMDHLRRNEFGLMPMDWDGEVIGLAPILDKLVVLGTEGVTGLILANTEMAATYGRRDLTRTGCAGRGAFHASDKRVLFVDTEGSLWQVTGELVPQRIGYQNLLSQMLGTDIVISWNEEDDDYYIANNDTCFLFNDQGLTRVGQSPTSVMFYQGAAIGVSAERIDQRPLIISEKYDLGIRGLKTINSANIGVTGENVEVAYDYKYKSEDDWRRTPFVKLNREACAYLRVTCLEFRVVVRADSFESFELDYIHIRWQASDKRQIRGLNVSSNAAGEGI